VPLHGVKYPFRNAAEKQIQRDLASNGYKPLDLQHFSADATDSVISLEGPNGHWTYWLANPLYYANAFQYVGAMPDGTVHKDSFFPSEF
jgi:hypothetical protein